MCVGYNWLGASPVDTPLPLNNLCKRSVSSKHSWGYDAAPRRSAGMPWKFMKNKPCHWTSNHHNPIPKIFILCETRTHKNSGQLRLLSPLHQFCMITRLSIHHLIIGYLIDLFIIYVIENTSKVISVMAKFQKHFKNLQGSSCLKYLHFFWSNLHK